MQSLFIPVSLGNRSFTRAYFTNLIEKFIRPANRALIVPCDFLKRTNLTIGNQDDIERRIGALTTSLKNMVVKILNSNFSRDERNKVRIELESDLEVHDDFLAVFSRLSEISHSESDVNDNLASRSLYWSTRIYGEIDSDLMAIERAYILRETALSIFCTEIMGYETELYFSGAELFVNYLYSEKPNLVKGLIAKNTLSRVFLATEIFARSEGSRR